jgi:mannose-6-phosphate isomerase-like protein (cupin superfamily)
MEHTPISRCHGGDGTVDCIAVLSPNDQARKTLKFFHDDVLPPGSSVGLHSHEDEEYYYVLEGTGEMMLDDRLHTVSAGDMVAVYPGGAHSLRNTGGSPMRIIVACVNPPPTPPEPQRLVSLL